MPDGIFLARICAVSRALDQGVTGTGALQGWQGLVQGQFCQLSARDVGGIFMPSNLECNPIEQFAGIHDKGHAIGCVREIALVARDEVIRLGGPRAMQEFGIGRIGRDRPGNVREEEFPLPRNMASAAAISSGGNANFGRASTAAYSSRMSSEQQGRTSP